MASKGHPYELSNPQTARAFVLNMLGSAYERELGAAVELFSTKHFFRYITGDRFTHALKPSHVLNSNDPDEKRPHVIAKIANGGEVRRFSAYLFETLGPDVDHVLDWIADLKTTGGKDYDKIPRMSAEVIVAKTNAWSNALARKPAGLDGNNAHVLDIDRDLAWFELTDARSLRYEGTMMSHCVGSEHYAAEVAAGRARIFSLRKNVSKPVLTVEISTHGSKPSLVQIQKHGNGGLPVAFCDAAVALLNTLDVPDQGRAQSYGLVLQDGTWKTVFDTWEYSDIAGRQALTDGKQALFMCATDASKPLLLVTINLGHVGPGDESPYTNVSVRDAGDMPPHYTDQREACDILGDLVRAYGRIAWLSISWVEKQTEDGNYIPAVDSYLRLEMDGGHIYHRPRDAYQDEAYFLPHATDPGRIIMMTRKDKETTYAMVYDGQRIARSQVGRCLAFLNRLDIHYIGKAGDSYSDAATAAFKREYQVLRASKAHGWKAFALDSRTVPAIRTDGAWEETGYLLRYVTKSKSCVDFYLEENRVVQTAGREIDREHVVEMVTKLQREKLEHDAAIRFESWDQSKLDVLLLKVGGQWDWVDSVRKFTAVARKVIDIGGGNEDTLNSLLSYGKRLESRLLKDGKNTETVAALGREILVAWFRAVKDFKKYPTKRKGLFASLAGVWYYPLVDRLCDLADQGYAPNGSRETAQVRKALRDTVSAYGRGKIKWPDDSEFGELLIRWYPHLPQKVLSKVSAYGPSFKSWEASRDAVKGYLSLLEDPALYRTNLRSAIKRAAESIVRSAEYDNMDSEAHETMATMFVKLARERELWSYHLEAMDRLLAVFLPVDSRGLDLRQQILDFKHKYEVQNAKYSSAA